MSLTSLKKKTDIYTNLTNSGLYRYPRDFKTDVTFDRKDLTLDGIQFTNITITGIPEGVSPLANEALIESGTPRRLYIISNTPLDTQYLDTIDKFYGKTPYPIRYCRAANTYLKSYPKNNFYMSDGVPSLVSNFVEYRYLNERHLISNIAYDPNTSAVYKLVLPERPLLVIIMPSNFLRTGLKTGYFRFENNLIIRVYSKYILSSNEFVDDSNEITSFTVDNLKLKTTIEQFFGRLGMHKIISNSDNQIYAYDKFMTLVAGSVANIILP